MQGLQQLNQQQGYEAGDRLIRETGEISCASACGALIEPSIARLGGGDFALLLPNIEHDEARRIGDTILHRPSSGRRHRHTDCAAVALSLRRPPASRPCWPELTAP